MIGICYMCSSPATNTCRLCGRLVCDKHFEARAGACTVCMGGVQAGVQG